MSRQRREQRLPPTRKKAVSVPSLAAMPMATTLAAMPRRTQRAGSQPSTASGTRQRRNESVSSAGSAWSLVSADELSASARRSVAKWLAQESALRVRGFSDDVFLADLRDTTVLCAILDKLGWLEDPGARARVEVILEAAREGRDERRGLPRAIRRENLDAFNASIAQSVEMDHVYVTAIEELRVENLDTVILPFLIEFKDIVDEANGALVAEPADSVFARDWSKGEAVPAASVFTSAAALNLGEVVERDEVSATEDTLADNAEGASPEESANSQHQYHHHHHRSGKPRRRRKQRTRDRALSIEDEDVDEALSSFIGLIIFLCVMFLILTFLTDMIGITDIGFAYILGMRKSPPPREDISWYADIKRSW